jgi:hypothetical protein
MNQNFAVFEVTELRVDSEASHELIFAKHIMFTQR